MAKLFVAIYTFFLNLFGISQATPSSVPSVPLPSKEDTIRSFCNLINEGNITGAISMMDVSDDTTKQSWGVTFNNFLSFEVKDIKKSSIDGSGNSFEVDIDITLKENLTNLPIPNYGFENGINKRWISLIEKEKGVYKITEIATGP